MKQDIKDKPWPYLPIKESMQFLGADLSAGVAPDENGLGGVVAFAPIEQIGGFSESVAKSHPVRLGDFDGSEAAWGTRHEGSGGVSSLRFQAIPDSAAQRLWSGGS